MNNNINRPRAAIHFGNPEKLFSSAEGAEAERRGWDEKMYAYKNTDANNHYDFSRKGLNFEINSRGEIVPLGSNDIPLHERVKHRLDKLGFKPYYDKDRPDVIADNSPNCVVSAIFSGDHDLLHNLAYGGQNVDMTLKKSNACIKLQAGIYNWAKDTYNFLCRRYGAENIIAFDVHCDETTPHIHAQIIPAAKTKTRGRVGFQYIGKYNPKEVLTARQWKKLPKEEQERYIKVEKDKAEKECVSYAKVFGENVFQVKKTYRQIHTDYYNEVGIKYGLERGYCIDDLSVEEQLERVHKNKAVLEAERRAKENLAKTEVEVRKVEDRKSTIEKQIKEARRRHDEAMQDAAVAELYRTLANVAEKQISVPSLNINSIIKKAYDDINEEFAVPIPSFGQKTWREERQRNIKTILTQMQTDLGVSRTNHNNEVTRVAKDIYMFYKRELSKLIKENEALRKENGRLVEDNRMMKDKLAAIDEKAVGELRYRLSKETQRADESQNQISRLSAFIDKLLSYPEIDRLWKNIQQREEMLRKEEETRKTEREKVYNDNLVDYISNAIAAVIAFAENTRKNIFSPEDEQVIGLGIIAVTLKENLDPMDENDRNKATSGLFDSIEWNNTTDVTPYRIDITEHRMHQLCDEMTVSQDMVEAFITAASGGYVTSSGGGGGGSEKNDLRWDGLTQDDIEAMMQPRGGRKRG